MTRVEIFAKLLMAAGGIFTFWLIHMFRGHTNWKMRQWRKNDEPD